MTLAFFFILLLLFILVNLVWNRRENYKKIVLTQFPLSREIRHMRLVRMRDSACGELRESLSTHGFLGRDGVSVD